jgi:hypothetical protein
VHRRAMHQKWQRLVGSCVKHRDSAKLLLLDFENLRLHCHLGVILPGKLLTMGVSACACPSYICALPVSVQLRVSVCRSM